MKVASFAALFAVFVTQPAPAQIFERAGIGQATLQTKSPSERAAILASLVEKANRESCKPGMAAFRRPTKEGGGFWYMKCASGREFLVSMPASADKGGVAMSCMLAKAMAGQDCHAK